MSSLNWYGNEDSKQTLQLKDKKGNVIANICTLHKDEGYITPYHYDIDLSDFLPKGKYDCPRWRKWAKAKLDIMAALGSLSKDLSAAILLEKNVKLIPKNN